jgi:hypothetical protein
MPQMYDWDGLAPVPLLCGVSCASVPLVTHSSGGDVPWKRNGSWTASSLHGPSNDLPLSGEKIGVCGCASHQFSDGGGADSMSCLA